MIENSVALYISKQLDISKLSMPLKLIIVQ